MESMRKRKRPPMTKVERIISRKYKEGQCRECCVVVEMMDFDNWFKKRKLSNVNSDIEKVFEDKTNKNSFFVPEKSIVSDNRLRRNENGMVLLPRTFYNKHPAKPITSTRRSTQKTNISSGDDTAPKKTSIFLKNKKTETKTKTNGMKSVGSPKEYQLVFIDPVNNNTAENKNIKFSLKALSSLLCSETLPSRMWEIERIPPVLGFPENPDGSYDAIAAELEALMGDSKKTESSERMETVAKLPSDVGDDKESLTKESKCEKENEEKLPLQDGEVKGISPEKDSDKITEEFPSIMDILNEKPICEPSEEKTKDVLLNESEISTDKPPESKDITEEHSLQTNSEADPMDKAFDSKKPEIEETVPSQIVDSNDNIIKTIIFRRFTGGDKQTYDRLVTFQHNLEFSVSIDERKVELLGAPEIITSIEDLQILLQIVDEVNPESFNVTYKS